MGQLKPKRWRRFIRAPLLLLSLGLSPVTLATRAASEPPAAPRSDAAALLEQALHARYECDTIARVRMTLGDRRGPARTRELALVSKRREGRLHALARLEAPAHLRGLTVLTVEWPDRDDDTFVYLPSLARTRRIAMHRRGEAFLGSDLTYRDFERHRIADYHVLSAERVRVGDEPALRVITEPRNDDRSQRVDFVIATSDRAILRLASYREGGSEPARVLEMPRASMRADGIHRIPMRLRAENPRRGTWTEVEVLSLELNPEIDDALFSMVTLESGRPLPKPSP